jgi:hypothetical protein
VPLLARCDSGLELPAERLRGKMLHDDALDLLAAKVARRLVVPPSAPIGDGWIDAKQAAAYLGTTLSSLWKLTAAHEIPVQSGRAWLQMLVQTLTARRVARRRLKQAPGSAHCELRFQNASKTPFSSFYACQALK